MENMVGDNVPSPKQLDALLAQLTANVEDLRKFCVILSEERKKQLLHPRHGGEEKVEKAADLCKRYNVGVPGVPVAGMLNDLSLARRIRPFVAVLETALQLVKDTESEAQSEYWEAYLALYGALMGASGHDPSLAAEAKELADFMKQGKRKKPGAEKGPK